jgi:hypothetical protein
MTRARDFADLAGSAAAGGITGRNLIINGAMQVAQRGTSISPATGAYSFSLDRWKSYSGSSYTISQQEFAAGQTDAPNIKNYMRIANGASTTSLHQLIEDVTTVSGTSVTLSFYIKGSSAYTLEIGAYQNFGSGGSATVNTANLATVAVTTSWTRVTATFTVPSISGKTVGTSSYLRIDIGTGTYYIPASNTTEITGIQLEVGETATPFEHRSYGDELARCQRYYRKVDTYSQTYLFTVRSSDDIRRLSHVFSTMRVDPTGTILDSGDGTVTVQGTGKDSIQFTVSGHSTSSAPYIGSYTLDSEL